MAKGKILSGGEVAAALNKKTAERVKELEKRGVHPSLAIIRAGEKREDISYERGASKRFADVGIAIKHIVVPEDIEQSDFDIVLEETNQDYSIHGILMLRPLPKQLDDKKARSMLLPEKDVDGCTDISLAGVFVNEKIGFCPCTAQAAIEILDYYGIDCSGKNAVIIGRSLVVGRPAAMLLMHRNATPTICHTGTRNVEEIIKKADIVIAASGKMESIGKDSLRPGQIVVDVGINWNAEKAKLCGDVVFEEAIEIADAVTPVPGGVGAVTTGVLAAHVAEAAERSVASNKTSRPCSGSSRAQQRKQQNKR